MLASKIPIHNWAKSAAAVIKVNLLVVCGINQHLSRSSFQIYYSVREEGVTSLTLRITNISWWRATDWQHEASIEGI